MRLKRKMMMFGIKMLLMCLFSLFLYLAFILSWHSPAEAHEDKGWEHMTEQKGIVGGKFCPMDISVWYIDDDGDGKVDRCLGIIEAHDTLHKAPYKMQMQEGVNGTRVPGCSCTQINHKN